MQLPGSTIDRCGDGGRISDPTERTEQTDRWFVAESNNDNMVGLDVAC